MKVKVKDIMAAIEEWAPRDFAEEWDNPGLQIGDPEQEVSRVVVTLDVDDRVVEAAEKRGAELIVSHHPLLYRELKNLAGVTPLNRLLLRLARAGIAVYSAHTNLDSCPGGINDELARLLGLEQVKVLHPVKRKSYCKIVVFVPRDHAEKVREAMCRAGAGHIGNYSDCTFRTFGVGTFRPLPGTNPYIGEQGKLEEVEEVRLETVIPASLVDEVVAAMLAAHPYEEVAYDLYRVEQVAPGAGLGRVGVLPDPLPLRDLARKVKETLQVESLRVGGDLTKPVQKVALCGGGGMALLPRVLAVKADVFITSDIKYHEARDAEAAGLAFIDAGHRETERIIVPRMAEYLREQAAARGWELEVTVEEGRGIPYRAW